MIATQGSFPPRRRPGPGSAAASVEPSWRALIRLNGLSRSYFSRHPQYVWGKSELLAYDLQSRSVLARLSVADDKQSHTLGDMTLTPSGDLVVSDGKAGGVYLLRRGGKQLDKLSDEFVAPQTPAMHPDGRHAFVPDYARGIGILDLVTHQVQWLRHPENVAHVEFAQPQMAVTPGQAAVFYDGMRVLGGGWITRALATPESSSRPPVACRLPSRE